MERSNLRIHAAESRMSLRSSGLRLINWTFQSSTCSVDCISTAHFHSYSNGKAKSTFFVGTKPAWNNCPLYLPNLWDERPLLGTSVHALTASNQTILVAFIVTFPFVVLAVFGWLVSQHHRKLYGPSDYRADKGFLDALGPLSPAEVRQKIEKEVAASEEVELAPRASIPTTSHPTKVGDATERVKPPTLASNDLRQALLIESLVFQDLQQEFKASTRRNVRLPNGIEVDGVLETADGSIVAVEITQVRSMKNYPDQIYRIHKLANSILNALDNSERKVPIRILLALVVKTPESLLAIREFVTCARVRLNPNVEIRSYLLSDLLDQYGLSEESHPTIS